MEKLLIEFTNLLDRALRELDRKAGATPRLSRLTPSQFHYIDIIHELGEPTITEIAERMGITKASVTASITRLRRMRLVTKHQSSEDRRVQYVSLTKTGQKLIKAKRQAMREFGRRLRATLSDDEIRRFTSMLNKLVRHFEEQE